MRMVSLRTMLYFTAIFFNLTYAVQNPGCIIGKWSLILSNPKLLPSHIRTIHPRENMSSVVQSWNRLIASRTLLKLSAHVSMTAAKPNKQLSTIQRDLWNCPKNVKEIAYTFLVRPKLEYASAAWDPFLKKDTSALERVQRKAVRFCSQNYNGYASVTDMIRDLGWATLETRRRQFRLTLMYKLTHGLIDIDRRKYLIQHSESRKRGGHQFKFRAPYANKDVFKFSFVPKTIADWNYLPEVQSSNRLIYSFPYPWG